MKRYITIAVLLVCFGCFWQAPSQTTSDAVQNLSYDLPYAAISGDSGIITIANPNTRNVPVKVTVQDQFGTQIDELTDTLEPNETRSFPIASLPQFGISLKITTDARLHISTTHTISNTTLETRIIEPEKEELPTATAEAAMDDDSFDGKVTRRGAAVSTITYGNNCGGQTSVGNPYRCNNGGNCTWWAWKMAKDNWGIGLPGWSDARTWATSARNAGYQVSATPKVQTIGVNTTLANGAGHVIWVNSVNGNQVCGSEMFWGSYGVRSNVCYPASTFNAGFIYPPSLTVSRPNGGEFMTRGTKQTISWSSTGTPGDYVRIELLRYGTLSSTIASSVPRGQTSGSYTWTIPYPLAGGSGYTVRITSTSNSKYTDTSNSTFTLY